MNRRLPIFVGAGALALVVLSFMFLYTPKHQEVTKAKADLEAAKSEQITLETQLQQLLVLKQQAQETRAKLNKIDIEIPPTTDKPGLIRMLALASDKAGVSLTVQSYSPPALTGTFSTMSVGMTVDGNFFQIEAFLNQLESLPRLMKVTSVGVTGATWPILNLTLTAETYTTDTNAGPGSTVGHQG